MIENISFDAKSFDDWEEYKGFPEGSGRSEKLWLQSPNGKIGLFKFPKFDSETGITTTEHISEHLASIIGKSLGIQTAEVDLGIYKNRVGSISYLVNGKNEYVIEGLQFILNKFPNYDKDNLIDKDSGGHYCLEYILSISNDQKWKDFVIKMVLFDFLIGNGDRHQNNWAVLVGYKEHELELYTQLCPLYDNGFSLCCYIKEEDVSDYMGKDINRFNALVDSKSKSIIRIHPFDKQRPTHREMVTYLIGNHSEALEYARELLSRFVCNNVAEYIDYYPDVLLSHEKKELIKHFLLGKYSVLWKVVNEVS